MPADELITFPAGVLDTRPVRLSILARNPEWFAVTKPAGLALGADSLAPDAPDLGAALAAAVAAKKRQLVELGIGAAERIHTLDAPMSGAALFALSDEAAVRLRNAIGSRQCEFVFDVLATGGGGEAGASISCDLPLARHAVEPRMLVSHASGKKCATVFAPVRALGRFTLWEARTRENRPHQVRLHAAESGLRIPGEMTYGLVPLVFLSRLKRGYRPTRERERPLHEPLAAHLREIVVPGADGKTTVVASPRPRSFAVLLRRLEEFGAGDPSLR